MNGTSIIIPQYACAVPYIVLGETSRPICIDTVATYLGSRSNWFIRDYIILSACGFGISRHIYFILKVQVFGL